MRINRTILNGHFTRDPQKTTGGRGDNQWVKAEFSIAHNEKIGDREEVTFVDVEAWGPLAEFLCQYAKKGTPATVEGKLRLARWESQGENRQKLYIRADDVDLHHKGPQKEQVGYGQKGGRRG